MMEALIEIHKFMTLRMAALQIEIDRDKGGGLADSKFKYDECKFWKEYIERKWLNDKAKNLHIPDSV